MRHLRWVLLLLGAGLLAALIVRDDPAAIAASIRRVSWGLAVLLCFPIALVTVLDTLGWRFAFNRDSVRFRTLVAARLAGEAFNLTTPTAAMGGEAVKAWLLRRHVTLAESIPSVIVAKTTITIAQGLFLLVGLVVASTAAIPDSALVHAMQWLLGIEALALAGFVTAQQRGMLGWWGEVLGRWAPRASRAGGTLQRMDDALARFYRRQPVRLLLSLACHFAAWVLGILEAYLILHFLGVPVSLATATVVEAFGTAVKFATFIVPGSLGVLEGGYAATFTALGFGSTLGVSFSLVRRIREATWAAIGLLVFAIMRMRVPEEAREA